MSVLRICSAQNIRGGGGCMYMYKLMPKFCFFNLFPIKIALYLFMSIASQNKAQPSVLYPLKHELRVYTHLAGLLAKEFSI